MCNPLKSSFVNQQDGSLALSYREFEENCFPEEIQRNSCYSIIWITEGAGNVKTGFSEYKFQRDTLFAFSPYQPYMILPKIPIKGVAINFDAEFIHIHQNEKERFFSRYINNDAHQVPCVKLDDSTIRSFGDIFQLIKAEMNQTSMAQQEMLAAYLKIFLINISRLETKQSYQVVPIKINKKENYILQKLKVAIEDNFRSKHSAVDYAIILFVSVKTLTRVSKSYYDKTVSEIINGRIIMEAKRELYLTNKTVKEIAYELGYDDEYYFSRFFKINTGKSPQKYRHTFAYDGIVQEVV